MSRRFCILALVLLSAPALAACGSSATTSSTATSSASASTSASASANGTASSTASTAASGVPTFGFEGVPLEAGPALAPASTTQTATVDGIKCGSAEQLAYHIHAHFAVFVNGKLYALPAGVGIAGSTTQQTPQGPIAAGGQCIYWLHTHTSDGVIHVESPTQRIYTLGNFFHEWHQPLSATQVGDVHGQITAFLNGKPWKRSLSAIPLLPHANIQFDIGEPTPPLLAVDWPQTHL